MATTGKELELKRTAMDVQPKELAQVMGVGVSRISYLENSRRVTPAAEAKYLAALATFGTIPTVTVETEAAA